MDAWGVRIQCFVAAVGGLVLIVFFHVHEFGSPVVKVMIALAFAVVAVVLEWRSGPLQHPINLAYQETLQERAKTVVELEFLVVSLAIALRSIRIALALCLIWLLVAVLTLWTDATPSAVITLAVPGFVLGYFTFTSRSWMDTIPIWIIWIGVVVLYIDELVRFPLDKSVLPEPLPTQEEQIRSSWTMWRRDAIMNWKRRW
jgi:hypothetical protein